MCGDDSSYVSPNCGVPPGLVAAKRFNREVTPAERCEMARGLYGPMTNKGNGRPFDQSANLI